MKLKFLKYMPVLLALVGISFITACDKSSDDNTIVAPRGAAKDTLRLDSLTPIMKFKLNNYWNYSNTYQYDHKETMCLYISHTYNLGSEEYSYMLYKGDVAYNDDTSPSSNTYYLVEDGFVCEAYVHYSYGSNLQITGKDRLFPQYYSDVEEVTVGIHTYRCEKGYFSTKKIVYETWKLIDDYDDKYLELVPGVGIVQATTGILTPKTMKLYEFPLD